MLTGLSISMSCHVQTPKISKRSGLYAGSGGTFLLSGYRVQISSVLAILKTSQVLLSHRNLISEGFPKKPDPEALGTQYIMSVLGAFHRVQVETCSRVMAF